MNRFVLSHPTFSLSTPTPQSGVGHWLANMRVHLVGMSSADTPLRGVSAPEKTFCRRITTSLPCIYTFSPCRHPAKAQQKRSLHNKFWLADTRLLLYYESCKQENVAALQLIRQKNIKAITTTHLSGFFQSNFPLCFSLMSARPPLKKYDYITAYTVIFSLTIYAAQQEGTA
ncbi:MAG: hypothetical protein ACLUFV_13820 [Acutalibacteraceae bacterium]